MYIYVFMQQTQQFYCRRKRLLKQKGISNALQHPHCSSSLNLMALEPVNYPSLLIQFSFPLVMFLAWDRHYSTIYFTIYSHNEAVKSWAAGTYPEAVGSCIHSHSDRTNVCNSCMKFWLTPTLDHHRPPHCGPNMTSVKLTVHLLESVSKS